MSAFFPPRAQAPSRPSAPAASPETLNLARTKVREMLESNPEFSAMPPEKRQALAHGMVQIAAYLAEPDGVRLSRAQQSPNVRALAGEDSQPLPADNPLPFGEALRTGVQQAGALMDAVNFPSFVSGLIDGVFNSIVTSSIEQMEQYAKLVADVSKSLNQFRDDNTTQNQGRDHLLEQFPDLFQLREGNDAWDFGSFGGEGEAQNAGPRVVMREGVDQRAAVARLNQSLPLERPLEKLDDELVEALLVPAARTQLASGRQQLLATLVMMGINRIVVTDGKISAKVLYDFQARDNSQYRHSATKYDHQKDMFGRVQKTTSSEGSYENNNETGSVARDQNGNAIRNYYGYGSPAYEGGKSYAKGDYKYNEQPIIKMMSTSNLQNDASLQAKASLAGQVEVNFKSDYLPLEKLANPESIAAIQMNAQPGMVKTLAARPPAGAAAPAGTSTATPAATPATATA